jgi:curli production assembly/transport component CsgG/holdfast attachment protein HfaB
MTLKKTTKLARAVAPATAAIAALALAGCVTPSASTTTGLYAKPIGDAPVTANPTPYSAGLVCLADQALANNRTTPRIAVGRILDYTGKSDAEGGRKLTQGASLMAITAFSKAGARLVERFDTSVSELELKYANNRLISDNPQADAQVRQIFAGQVPGSDFYLVGGITELNYNIRSTGVDAFVGQTASRDTKGNVGAKLFVMNIGLDLRLVDTKSLEVVDVISYQKQVIGRELRAGVFSFFGGDTLFDIGAGERAIEPMQLAVRATIERAVLEMMANLYRVDTRTVCADAIRAGGDPLGSASSTGDFRTYRGPASGQIADRRADPNAWNVKRDPVLVEAAKAQAPAASQTTGAAPLAQPGRPVGVASAAPVTRQPAAQPAPVRAAPAKPVRSTLTGTRPAQTAQAPTLRGLQ